MDLRPAGDAVVADTLDTIAIEPRTETGIRRAMLMLNLLIQMFNALLGDVRNAEDDIDAIEAIIPPDPTTGVGNDILGLDSGAVDWEWKEIAQTANQVLVAHSLNTITLSTPQDIHTTADVTFGSLDINGTFEINTDSQGATLFATAGKDLYFGANNTASFEITDGGSIYFGTANTDAGYFAGNETRAIFGGRTDRHLYIGANGVTQVQVLSPNGNVRLVGSEPWITAGKWRADDIEPEYLEGGVALPGATKYYGTDSGQNLGFHSMSSSIGVGGSNSILTMNSTGSGYTWRTIAAGQSIELTTGAGGYTIATKQPLDTGSSPWFHRPTFNAIYFNY